MRTMLCALAMMFVPCLVSCSDNTDQSARVTGSAAPRPKIEVAVKDREAFQAQIKSHAGKVVVVDLWALW